MTAVSSADLSEPGTAAVAGLALTLDRFTCGAALSPVWEKNGVICYPHQLEAARRILEEMDGSGILADEVGLGKTVEAGLIVRELLARGDLTSLLVLCPASLVDQWHEEMGTKFDLHLAREGASVRGSMGLCSLDWAKRLPQARVLQERAYDLVIVDEAHRLKNRRTKNYAFVRSLRTRRLLLLTATPIENELMELYSLVSLVRPDVFGNYLHFYRRFIVDRHTPRNVDDLRSELSQVMVRQKRVEVGVGLPERQVNLVPLRLSDAETHLYDEVTRALRGEYRRRLSQHSTILPLIMLQRELCSSTFALSETLSRMSDGWLGEHTAALLELARAIQDNAKARVVDALVENLQESVIVYTEYRATQQYLAARLRRSGKRVFEYHGSLPARVRTNVCKEFERAGGVLLSTDAGGQGLNLQFCRVLVNYDLPWNPMRVEQRIGRVHRLGQTRPVQILNLYAEGTVEEHILRLLHMKIDLFRRVIGDVDVILRQIERERPIEAHILEIVLGATSDMEVRERLDHLGDNFVRLQQRDASRQQEGFGAAAESERWQGMGDPLSQHFWTSGSN